MKKTLQEVREYINEGVYDPGIFKAFFLAGGPGSGKTFVTSSAFAGTGLKLVNSDVKFERDLKKANLSLKMPDEEAYFRDIIRKGAKEFVGKQLDQYLKGRLGLIIDSTARDYSVIQRQYNLLRNIGYDCYMVFVNTSLDVAIERNRTRSRSIPEYIVQKSWKGVQANMGAFQKVFGHSKMLIVDNNRDDKELVTQTLNTASRFIRSRLRTKPENGIAMSWIKRELEAKKRI
jgi:shikimate kinase